MAKGFSKEEGDALNSCVRGIVERAIASLMVIGMTHEGALNLLMIQAAIRMEDGITETKRLLRSLENDHQPPEGQRLFDSLGGTKRKKPGPHCFTGRPGRKIINLLFSGGVFENKFRIFKWVRVEGLQWHR